MAALSAGSWSISCGTEEWGTDLEEEGWLPLLDEPGIDFLPTKRLRGLDAVALLEEACAGDDPDASEVSVTCKRVDAPARVSGWLLDCIEVQVIKAAGLSAARGSGNVWK
jgi:hypothetical protein